MELIFKTKTYKTKISKYATIYCNDPDQPTVKIHLSSNVYPTPDSTLPYKVSPDRVSLSQDENKSKIVFENVGASKLFIEPVGGPLEGLKIDVKNDDPKPGQSSELKFEWKGEFEKENMERSVTFHVSGSEQGTYRFSVPFTIQGTDPTPPRTTARTKARSQNQVRPKRPVQSSVKRPVKTLSKPKTDMQTEIKQTESAGKTDLKKQTPESTFKEEFPTDDKAVEEKTTKQPEASSDQDQ